jgi:hypothetical protein
MIDVEVDKVNDTYTVKIGTEQVLSTYILTADEFLYLQRKIGDVEIYE